MELSNASNNSVTTFDEIPEVYDYVIASTIHPVVPEEYERPAPPAETRAQHKVPTKVPIQPQVPVKKPKVPLKPKVAGKVFVDAKIPVEEEYDIPIRRANEFQHYENNEGLIYNVTYGTQM